MAITGNRLGLDAAGWLHLQEGVRHCPSPNFDERPTTKVNGEVTLISLVVIHAISLPPGQFENGAVERFFLNRLNPQEHPYFANIAHLKVSSHFLIHRNGLISQFVSTQSRAWHAGESTWLGCSRCNDFSIGIEWEGDEQSEFCEVQYQQGAALLETLCLRYPIDGIAGHQHIAPGRKWDPGATFRWQHLQGHLASRLTQTSHLQWAADSTDITPNFQSRPNGIIENLDDPL